LVLSVGSQFELNSTRRPCTVTRFIGEGSQGSVWEVAVGPDARLAALKWYFPHTGTPAQRASIVHLLDRGAPDQRFLWPSELVELPGEPAFGYLMPLRPATSVGLSELLTGKVDVPFSIICTLGLELADSFLSLHSEGLCYRDISFGNVFFDPSTGRPLICDNDNVGIDGASPSFVLGTRRFMAPEIVRRESSPNTATDLYSLSVLLFYLLMVGHPLVGRRELDFPTWDDHAESHLFGAQPVFVFDPGDRSNEPLDDLHGPVVENWKLYPDHIRKLFTTAFTTGLDDPRHGRVRESVWRSAMARLRDAIQRCAACRKENFWQGGSGNCWFCDRPLAPPLRLVIDGRTLVLNDDTIVRGHHLSHVYDDHRVVARIARHPDRPERWGLRNETSTAWPVTLPSGETTTAEPGRAVGLLPGTSFVVDGATASIEV
jgi:DNA-binding helix-hairpin-helix protein with protein kinase domain